MKRVTVKQNKILYTETMKRVFLISLTLILFSIFSTNVSAQSFKGYKTLKTDHFDFVYEPLSKEFVPLYAQYAEEAYKKIAKYSMGLDEYDKLESIVNIL